MTARGATGRLVAGTRQAAVLCGWSVATDASSELGVTHARIDARLRDVDPFWAQQRPATVQLRIERGVLWCWTSDEVTIAGDQLRMSARGAPDILHA